MNHALERRAARHRPGRQVIKNRIQRPEYIPPWFWLRAAFSLFAAAALWQQSGGSI
jgi:hypothetical protein